jgi:hypothetical protein
MEAKKNEPLLELIRDLRDETATLVRQETALAKAELAEKIACLLRDLIYIACGVAFGGVALILLLLAFRDFLFTRMIDAGVRPEMAMWVAPLVTAVVIGFIGWLCIVQGKKVLAKEGFVPHKTIATVEEDKNWLKEKVAES